MCVCVCEREREKARERNKLREIQRDTMSDSKRWERSFSCIDKTNAYI